MTSSLHTCACGTNRQHASVWHHMSHVWEKGGKEGGRGVDSQSWGVTPKTHRPPAVALFLSSAAFSSVTQRCGCRPGGAQIQMPCDPREGDGICINGEATTLMAHSVVHRGTASGSRGNCWDKMGHQCGNPPASSFVFLCSPVP